MLGERIERTPAEEKVTYQGEEQLNGFTVVLLEAKLAVFVPLRRVVESLTYSLVHAATCFKPPAAST